MTNVVATTRATERRPERQTSEPAAEPMEARRGGPHAGILRLQRMAGNGAVTNLLADQRLRRSSLRVYRSCASCAAGASKCSHCENEERLQRKPAAADREIRMAAIRDVIGTTGRPLDSSTARWMGERFGRDFSDVEIHDGTAAAESARTVNALAYTVGRHIVFGEGQFDPGSDRGRRILAHELAHVVQQRRGGSPPPLDTDAPHEREAAAAAAAALRGGTAVEVRSASGVGVARQNQPLSREEMFSEIVTKQRAWMYSPGGVPGQDPTGVGRGVGPAAGGRRAGFSVFAAIQVVDRNGRLVDVGYGQHVAYGAEHAEQGAMRALAQRVPENQTYRGGTMTVVVDQTPCPPGRADCMGGLREFARRRGLGLEVWVPTRESASQPGRQVAPRTAGMSAQRTDVQPVTLRRLDDMSFPPPSTGGGAPAARGPQPAGGPSLPAPRPGAPRTAALPTMALQRQRLLATLESQTRKSAAFTARIRIFSGGLGAVSTVLGAISQIKDAMTMARSGTLFADAQAQLEAMGEHGQEAIDWAQEVTGSISLLESVAQVSDAIERADSDALFDVGSSLGDLGMELSDRAESLERFATDLNARAAAVDVLADFYETLMYVPQGPSTAPQAHAFSMHESITKLSGALRTAGHRFGEAGSLLRFHGDYIQTLGYRANRAAWSIVFENIAREQARREAERPPAPPSSPQQHESRLPSHPQPALPPPRPQGPECPSCHAQRRQWAERSVFERFPQLRETRPEDERRLREWIEGQGAR